MDGTLCNKLGRVTDNEDNIYTYVSIRVEGALCNDCKH